MCICQNPENFTTQRMNYMNVNEKSILDVEGWRREWTWWVKNLTLLWILGADEEGANLSDFGNCAIRKTKKEWTTWEHCTLTDKVVPHKGVG